MQDYAEKMKLCDSTSAHNSVGPVVIDSGYPSHTHSTYPGCALGMSALQSSPSTSSDVTKTSPPGSSSTDEQSRKNNKILIL